MSAQYPKETLPEPTGSPAARPPMHQPSAQRQLKRYLDVVLASAALLAAAPLLVAIAAALKLEGTTPVIFRQQRTGLDGRLFTIYKFRTMSPEAPGQPHQQRATRVGQWLRRFALDELPQLWNVLRGEMSIIGPRPALPEQAKRYGKFERRRLQVKPGITGWAQINGRNSLSWSRRIELDVWYIENGSLWTDLSILIRTPLQLAKPQDVYGANGTNVDFTPRPHE